ncbi:MAG: Ig-like domain-containing protein [Candidatus Marinimicrobia bacterium]|nr:Ig-like domain-containing protein [Candidatus Neomarinimicrobiota bacterium]
MVKLLHNQTLRILLLPGITAGLLIFSWRCAAIRPPSGGPKDTTPPVLLAADPPSETLRISGGLEIILSFSEYIAENTMESGFNLSPISAVGLKTKYHNDAIAVTLPDSLVADQTYILTVSRQLKDEHGVELAEPVHLAYSTGDKIEQGVIRGNVYFNDGPTVVHLWDLSLITDTDSIFARMPHFVTDVTDDGHFTFQFLRPAKYQIVAIDRSGAGFGLNTIRTAYGVYRENLVDLVYDSLITGINLPMWKEPQPLRLLRGEWAGQNWGRLFFNNFLRQSPQQVTAVYDDSARTILTLEGFLDPLDSSTVIIISNDLIAAAKIKLHSRGLIDIYDQTLDTASIAVRVPAQPDTTSLSLVEPGASITIKPENLSVYLVLNKPVTRWPRQKAVILVRDDSIQVELAIDSISAIQVGLRPEEGWLPQTEYNLVLAGDSLIALGGNMPEDSLILVKIKVAKPTGLGGIAGTVSSAKMPAIIKLSTLEKSSRNHLSDVNSDSSFRFDNIPEGYYHLMVFQDGNQNRRFDFGTAFPFTSSEWFYLYPDTVEVRANWIIELPTIHSKEVQ